MNSESRIVYLLDDEHGIVRALTRLLSPAGYEVRGFTSPSAFLDAWRYQPCSCLVLDVAMPELNGLQLQKQLTSHGVLLPIVFLTGQGNIPASVQAIKAGAVDFLTKPVRKADLLRAVEAALERSMEQQETAAHSQRLTLLTSREREVMERMVAGRLNKQIAAEFGTGEQNIKFHRANIMKKMRVESFAELVRLAEKLGIGQRMPGVSAPDTQS